MKKRVVIAAKYNFCGTGHTYLAKSISDANRHVIEMINLGEVSNVSITKNTFTL